VSPRAESWVDEPLRRFVRDTDVLLAIVMHPSGQVLGQHGFTRAMDVMAACALAAAIQASSAELGRVVDGKPFSDLYHAGESRQIFLGSCDTRRGRYLLLAIFDDASSIGLVHLFFENFRAAMADAVEKTPPAVPLFGEDFDRALARSLDALFALPLPNEEGPSAAR
jgi:hypothetical protein